MNIKIIGIDLKKDVIDFCKNLKEKLEYKNLLFYNGDVKNFKFDKNIQLCVSLHACNTVTDYALYNSVILNSKCILSVPCCHKEIYNQIKNSNINFMLKHGIIKEKFSTILTDSIRGLILEIFGYKCNLIEFISEDNTPKNVMIRAIKKDSINKNNIFDKKNELNFILNDFKIRPYLFRLFEKELTINEK